MQRRTSPPGVGIGGRARTPVAPLITTAHDLTAHVPRIQTARDSRVGRSLDDRPAVGKQRHFIRLAPELQHKLVMPALALRPKAGAQLHKVAPPPPLPQLHRVPPPQRYTPPP